MGTTINTPAFLERLRNAWQDRGVQRRRQAQADANAKCMKCHQDLADGKITAEEHEFWLRQYGEPALANAMRDRQLAEAQHYDKVVEPILLEWRQANAARKRAALAELRAANADDIAIETAWRTIAPKDLQRHSASMIIP